MATLEVNNISKSFQNIEVLKNVSIQIKTGDFLVLVGPSGCGKSTLLNIIAGLLDATKGSISIDGKKIDHLEPKERNIAMVFQSYALYPAMTVFKNIAFPLRMANFSKSQQTAKVKEVAELLQIEHLLNRKPNALSGGQRQRVAMGRALVRDPAVFLFDEPLSNLDAKLRVDMRTEIKKLHQRLKTTIVYVTHDQVEAMTLASKIAVMKDGVVQQFGTPGDIYDNPTNTFVATFMGSPAMNLLEGIVQDGFVVLPEGSKIALPSRASSIENKRKIKIGIRPEWFNTSTTSGRIKAEVEILEPTGPDIYATLKIGEQNIMARLPSSTELKVGDIYSFDVNMEKASIFEAKTGFNLY